MIFQTKDILKKRPLDKLNKLYNSVNLIELDFVKLFMGLSKITYRGKDIKQPNNYLVLGIKENQDNDLKYLNIVNFLRGESSKVYFDNNRKNNIIFKVLLNELGLYFIAKDKKNYVEGFIHLYRIIEKISLMFPLLYFKQSSNFIGVFKDIKELIVNKDTTSLKFFKNFQKLIFEDVAMMDTSIDFCFIINNTLEESDLKRIFEILSKEIKEASLNGNTITVPFKNVIDLAITVRNRYFHLAIEDRENIEVTNLDINDFFSSINENILNWIGVVYYEMFKILNRSTT